MQELQEEREEAVPGAAPGLLAAVSVLIKISTVMLWCLVSWRANLTSTLATLG